MDFSNIKTGANLSFTQDAQANLVVTISGELTTNTLPTIWNQAIDLQKKYSPQTLILETKNLTFADSIGALFILELKKFQTQAGKKFLIQNQNPELTKTLTFLEQQKVAPETAKTPELNIISRIGEMAVNILLDLKDNVAFCGSIIVYLWQTILHPGKVRWQDFWRAMEDIGPKALPIVFLIGFLVGVIITFQSAAPFAKFGAQIYIVDLVGLGLVREMGPLMTAILISGRTASAFAAEIGSMKINQEVDALTTMGIEPIKFLAIPRIFAAIIMTPLLNMFTIAAGLLGCFIIMISLGNNIHMISNELYNIVSLKDFFAGLFKTFIFGAVIASIGCLHGTKTSVGSSAVGVSTTKAVVSSLIMLTVVDGIFAVIYYLLGI